MRRTGKNMWRGDQEKTKRAEAGFTLVELIVAMAIAGTLSVAVFQLFGKTADTLQEADSLAGSLDRARFVIEQLRSDIQNAGTYASPDSTNDPYVRPNPVENNNGNNVRVSGFVSYPGWQDDRSIMPDTIATANSVTRSSSSGDSTLENSFDGFIVIGAYDFPLSFEVHNIQANGSTGVSGDVLETERGLYRLKFPDPFREETGNAGYDFGTETTYDSIQENSEHRILRVMNHEGFFQFTGISSEPSLETGGTATDTGNRLRFSFQHPLALRQAGQPYGLDPHTQQSSDSGYPGGALLDAYWYHVEQDPQDESNFRLVRERLDGGALIAAMTQEWSDITPEDLVADGDTNTVVIADRVVDFQVWADCVETGTNGNLRGLDWEGGWSPPDGTETGHDCLDLSNPNPGRVRIVHVRLSVRTDTERTSLAHHPFPSGADDSSTTMQTFDVYPDAKGAARVVTVQGDFELPNYTMRNIY